MHELTWILCNILQNLITNQATHVIHAKKIRMKFMSFSCQIRTNFFQHVVWIFLKYHILKTWIWCEKFEHQIHIKISCENKMKKFRMDFMCNFHVKMTWKNYHTKFICNLCENDEKNFKHEIHMWHIWLCTTQSLLASSQWSHCGIHTCQMEYMNI